MLRIGLIVWMYHHPKCIIILQNICQTSFKKVAIKNEGFTSKKKISLGISTSHEPLRKLLNTQRIWWRRWRWPRWLGRMLLISDALTDGKRPSLFAYLHYNISLLQALQSFSFAALTVHYKIFHLHTSSGDIHQNNCTADLAVFLL